MIETFRHHSRVLAAKSSTLELVHHDGDRGAEREDLLREFLQPLLPERIGIGGGEIHAVNGTWSRQEDIVLYDKLNCPRLFVGNRSQIFPAESVGVVIEVKSSLGSKEMAEASNNIAQVRLLGKTGLAMQLSPGSIVFGPPTPILGCVFGYRLGLKAETFRQKWAELQLNLPPEQRTNLVCVLDQLTVVHVDRVFHLWDSASEDMINSIVFQEFGADSLMVFTLGLLRVLAEIRFGTPDLLKYYFSDGASLEFSYKYAKRA